MRLAQVLLFTLVFVSALPAQWVKFQDETGSRLQAATTVGAGDVQEKDYAWADLDQDGDIDLVCVRKQPFTTRGRFPNVLFMNEGGVLVDRSATLASHSTVAGSQGFLDSTNDRDVAIADVDGDGWLDLVTAVTLSGSQPRYISHPRVYINRGLDGNGVWLGFTFDDETRIPLMSAEPRFCSVSLGDIDGDGDIDCYMGDYQQGGNRPVDLNDRLFINDGSGYFSDESATRMTATMLESSFAMQTEIIDLNGDGKLDILKDDALNAPQGVSVSYNANNPGMTEGFFGTYEVIYSNAPYHFDVGDLNNDGLMDLIVSDDGADRYQLASGMGSDGLLNFNSPNTFSFTGGGSDDGFAGNNLIVDLNNDGWNDAIITDVDVDISGCSRRANIYRNLGNAPNVTLREEQSNGLIANIPVGMLVGSHDVAVFDINGDGWKDMVLGRCTGTQVYMNVPPTGVAFSYPQGLPGFVDPSTPQSFQVQATGIGGTQIMGATGTFYYSVNGQPYTTQVMTSLGNDLYEAQMPGGLSCGDRVDFYVSVQAVGGVLHTDPSNAPLSANSAIVATGTVITMEDGFENGMGGWSVVNSASLTTGAWEIAIPVPTTFGSQLAAPPEDAQASTSDTHCFVTQNGSVGGFAGTADVDGGPTALYSPVLDLAGTDATITFSRWFFSSGSEDLLNVSVTADGSTWVPVESINGIGNQNNQWLVSNFRVSDFVTPSATVQVRFSVRDASPGSICEAAIDLFRVEELMCTVCQADLGMGGPGNATLAICGGDLSSGTTADLMVSGATPNTLLILLSDAVLSPTAIGVATLLNPNPDIQIQVATDANGEFTPPGIAGGAGPLTLYVQAAFIDPMLPLGFGLTNVVQADLLP